MGSNESSGPWVAIVLAIAILMLVFLVMNVNHPVEPVPVEPPVHTPAPTIETPAVPK